MKRLFLILICLLSFIYSHAQYCEYPHFVNRIYRVAPVHMVVRKSPRVIVVEEENKIIYLHKKVKPEITHIYVENVENELIDDEITLHNNNDYVEYNKMWKQTIWFNEDEYHINKDYNKITLDNVAKFMKDNFNVSIEIYGYASKKHGSYIYNKQLAANRCKETKKYLVSEYNISPSRIQMIIRGTDTPEYYVDKWNQCVIIKCK